MRGGKGTRCTMTCLIRSGAEEPGAPFKTLDIPVLSKFSVVYWLWHHDGTNHSDREC
jgi:hypothetical protein